MLPLPAFTIARLPRIVFGAGSIAIVPQEARALGRRALVVTGARAFRATAAWPRLMAGLADAGVAAKDLAVDGEPSPGFVDAAVDALRQDAFDVVIGVGGGSALDAAKAIAGLLNVGRSVMDYLEGVGPERPYEGPAVPMIAVPTTAGTGSEATKNAVLSQGGAAAFKKSFRHETLVPCVAIVDPELLASCPRPVVAANGMDCFTQLLESYTSTKANPFTDALAWSGMVAFGEGFFDALEGGVQPQAQAGRSRMAYAALLSGVCLAQTGLGAVHGLASPLGAHYPIPHGACCGTLVAGATAANIRALSGRGDESLLLGKYAEVGRLLIGEPAAEAGKARSALIETLTAWTDRLGLPLLSRFGMRASDIPRIVAESRGSSMKTNPIVLSDGELADILSARL